MKDVEIRDSEIEHSIVLEGSGSATWPTASKTA